MTDKYLKAALSQAQAEVRAKLFTQTQDNIHYKLLLKIKKGETFEGHLNIDFQIDKTSNDLFLDFAGSHVHEFFVNNNKVPTTDNYESLRDRRFLKVPEPLQVLGKNEIRIHYSSVYANDGLGLHSFTDTDGKQYIYSQCEAYAANKIFPCFDQPDLKATLSLVMSVPNDWVAVANQSVVEENAQKIEAKTHFTEQELNDHKLFAFKTTPRLPTYLFAFCAGPYHELKCNDLHNNITMSCYCRESLLQYLKDQSDEIFDVTKESLKFYETYFNYPYPFEKYDSVFCPEYKFGAMENPGVVTFNDRLIWREKVTQDRNTMRSIIIAHEAAHHWFGDLVTMKWWNDLWLNESFAEYISHYCLYNIRDKVTTTKFSEMWLAFFNEKGWGYDTDQKKTTHPIAGEVLNTDQAESIFDGITYSKGAATLKQLMQLIGEENFGRAMSSYFKTYEWSNATLNQFIAKLQDYYLPRFAGSPANLDEWKAEWLQTAGLNECEPLFNKDDTDKEAKLVIRQGAALANFATLRHHKMKVAFFDEDGKLNQEQDIMLQNAPETVITYDGSQRIKAVVLNYQDEAFIKIRLDQQSIAFFREKLNAIPDQLTRAMVWRALYDMVRDGKLSAYKFIDIAIGAIPSETSDSTLSNILNYIVGSFEYSPSIVNENVLKPKMFTSTLNILKATDKLNTNRIVLLRENLIRFASVGDRRTVDNFARLIDWLEGTDLELKEFNLEVKDRWSIVNLLHGYSKLTDTQKAKHFLTVAGLDNSDRMKLAETRCEAMRAHGILRQRLFESYLDPHNKLSVQMLQQSMNGYNHSPRHTPNDENLFFDNVVHVFQTRNNEFAQSFYNNLFPYKDNLTYYIERVQNLLESAQDNDWLKKSLLNSLDTLEGKRRGFLCSAPDLMKEFYNISY